jgi:hypothetical protein
MAADLGRVERAGSEDEQDHDEGDGDGERDDGDRAGAHGGSERVGGNLLSLLRFAGRLAARVAGRARRAARERAAAAHAGSRAALAAAQPWSSWQRTWLCRHRPWAGDPVGLEPSGDLSEREAGATLAPDLLGDSLPGPLACAVHDELDGAVHGYVRPSAGR